MQTSSFDGVENHNYRFAALRCRLQRREDRPRVMPLGMAKFDPKREKSLRKIATRNDFLSRPKTLKAILIDQNEKIVEALMHGEYERLPTAPFLPFAIGTETERSLAVLFVAVRQSQSCSKRRPMAQRSRREQEPWNSRSAGMRGQQGTISSESS
jgi:hypothetical protein